MKEDPSSHIEGLLRQVTEANPVTATQLGLLEGADRLPSYSPSAVAAYVDGLRKELVALRALAAGNNVQSAVDAALGVQIVCRVLRNLVDRRVHRIDPCLYLDAAYGVLLLMMKRVGSPEDRLQGVKGRLESLPGLLEQGHANLQGGLVPRPFVENALVDLPGVRETVDDGARAFAGEVGRAGVLDVASREAVAALDRFESFLRDELLPAAVDDCAAGPAAHRQRRRRRALTDGLATGAGRRRARRSHRDARRDERARCRHGLR